jgi:hypothetical protein
MHTAYRSFVRRATMSAMAIRSSWVFSVGVGAALLAHAPLRAAEPPDSLLPVASSRFVRAAILWGTLGSAAGVLGGGALGTLVGCGNGGGHPCGLPEAGWGAVIGSSVGAALGANRAVRKAGGAPRFKKTFVASLVGAFVGSGAAWLGLEIEDSGGLALVGYSLSQGLIAGLWAAAQR